VIRETPTYRLSKKCAAGARLKPALNGVGYLQVPMSTNRTQQNGYAIIPLTNLLLHNYLEVECIQPTMWATLYLLEKL